MAKNKNQYISGVDMTATTCLATGGVATGATTTVSNFTHSNGLVSEIYYTGTNTARYNIYTINDTNCTVGAYFPNGNADNAGITWTFGGSLLISNPTRGAAFTVGTDPAFFMEAKIGIPDISDYDVMAVGFVEPAASHVATINTNAAFKAAYDEKAMLGLEDNAGAMAAMNSVAGVDAAITATQVWADDEVLTLRVNVSAAGAVTYLINGAVDALIEAGTAQTLADATVVYPCIIACKAATAADTPPIINYVKWGLQ